MMLNKKFKVIQVRFIGLFIIALAIIVASTAQSSTLPTIISLLLDDDSVVTEPTVRLDQNYDALSNGSAWPSPWQVATNSPVQSFTIQNGEACLEGLVLTGGMPSTGEQNLARMVTPGLDVGNFDARFQITMGDPQNQGLGFYGIQNDGFFTLTNPAGQGYGVFIRGYSVDQFTFWYEFEGDEVLHEEIDFNSIASVGNNFTTDTYNIRYQVEYINAITGTIQRAKIWLEGGLEPAEWLVADTTGIDFPAINPRTISSLQNITGGFVVDLYNFNNPTIGGATASACIDNLVIQDLN